MFHRHDVMNTIIIIFIIVYYYCYANDTHDIRLYCF